MAREFDELQSMMARRRGRSNPQDPSVDTFRERFAPFSTDPSGDLRELIEKEQKFREGDTPVRPGRKERYGDPTKVISQYIPPSTSATNMKQFPLPPAPATPETTGVRPPPPRGLGLPEGGQGLEGVAAGTLPPPPFLQLIERLHQQRNEAQGIPGRARGGPIEADRSYVVGERGPERVVLAGADGQVPIPEGFSLEPPPKPMAIPEGFSLKPPEPNLPAPGAGTMPNETAMAPAAAPMAGVSQWSPDEAEQAREVAAARLAQGAQPQGGRQEGAATRAIEAVVPALGAEAQRVGNIAKGAIQEGDLPPAQAMEAALAVNPASVAYRTGLGVARAALPSVKAAEGIHRAAQEVGVDIPKAALAGENMQATARGLAAVPIGGAPLRRAATQADEQLAAAGTAAAARPTGEAVGQDVAGGHVRKGITAAGEAPPARLQALARKSNEDAIGEIVRMAGSKTGADAASLSQLRKYVPAENQAEVQSALISRLGRGSTGEFDADTWIRNYGNLSDRGKNALFGRESADLRTHLDAIEAVARRAESWQQFNQKRSTLGTKVGTAAVLAGAWAAPMATLTALVPARALSGWLARSATAAPLAQYSRAYERVVRTNGAPQAMAAFGLAVKNMNSNLGTTLTPDDILQAGSGGGGSQE